MQVRKKLIISFLLGGILSVLGWVAYWKIQYSLLSHTDFGFVVDQPFNYHEYPHLRWEDFASVNTEQTITMAYNILTNKIPSITREAIMPEGITFSYSRNNQKLDGLRVIFVDVSRITYKK